MKPYRSSKYLAWIRSLPCVICRVTRNIEAAHTGPHGMSQKSPDISAIPLCAYHHRTGPTSYHQLGSRKFQQVHKLDIPSLVRSLSKKPLIRVVHGSFVGQLGDREYILGRAEDGLKPAVKYILSLCREERSAAQ